MQKFKKSAAPTPFAEDAKRAFCRPKGPLPAKSNLTLEMAQAKADPAYGRILAQSIRDGRVRFGS